MQQKQRAHSFEYRVAYELVAGCATLILLLTIGFYSELALIPSWEATRPATMAVFALLAAATGTMCFFVMPKARQSLLRRVLMTGITNLVIVFVLAVSLLDFSMLGGSMLKASFHSPSSNRSLFVYEESSIPDGFERTYLMERHGLLPMMHEIYSVPYQVQSTQQVATSFEIVFRVYSLSEEHYATNESATRYDLQSGSLDLDDMPPQWRLRSDVGAR